MLKPAVAMRPATALPLPALVAAAPDARDLVPKIGAAAAPELAVTSAGLAGALALV
jgi:hypothetical protein